MADRDNDLCYWDGEPINAMTREALQKALGDAVMIIERKNRQIFDLEIIRQDQARLTNERLASLFIAPNAIAAYSR